jgi:hypothetical protein
MDVQGYSRRGKVMGGKEGCEPGPDVPIRILRSRLRVVCSVLLRHPVQRAVHSVRVVRSIKTLSPVLSLRYHPRLFLWTAIVSFRIDLPRTDWKLIE